IRRFAGDEALEAPRRRIHGGAQGRLHAIISHVLKLNFAVTPSARVRRQSSLTERRKILPKSPLFFFISCSFNLPTHGSDMFVMGIMKQLFLCFERHRISFFLVQLTHAEMHDKSKLNSLLMLPTFVALYSP
ncbi:hypothetical protein HID58_053747, partial [Brassica napus]